MRSKDILIGVIMVFIWGVNWVAIEIGLKDMPPFLLAAVRFAITCFPIILFLPKPPVSWKSMIALGFSLNVFQFAILFLGMKLGMPAGLASLVIQAQAFFTLLIAVFFLKEKWYLNQVLGLLLASFGMLIIGLQHDGSVTAIGFLLTIVSALFWGIANIITKKISHGLSSNQMFSLIVWIAGVSVPPLMLLSLYMEGTAVWQKAWDSLNGVAVFAVFFQAYLSTLGGYGFWFNLLSKYPASIVSPFSLLVPIIGMSSCGLVLGETLSIWQFWGAFLVMAGLAINVFGQKLYSKFKVLPDGTTE